MCGLVAKLCPTLANPWTLACQVLLSVGFLSQEYWSGLPFPSPGDVHNPGIKPGSDVFGKQHFKRAIINPKKNKYAQE